MVLSCWHQDLFQISRHNRQEDLLPRKVRIVRQKNKIVIHLTEKWVLLINKLDMSHLST